MGVLEHGSLYTINSLGQVYSITFSSLDVKDHPWIHDARPVFFNSVGPCSFGSVQRYILILQEVSLGRGVCVIYDEKYIFQKIPSLGKGLTKRAK